MKKLSVGIAVVTWAMAGAGSARASEPQGVYARVDKVVLEPPGAAATRIQIHGAFGMTKGYGTGDNYEVQTVGYLYLACPAGMEATCRMECNPSTSGVAEVAEGLVRAAAATSGRDG